MDRPLPDPIAETDALAEAVRSIGDRWMLLIVDALLAGPKRFNDLQSEVVGIASNVLAKRLEHLERESIVVARPYSARPPRYAYELTVAGHELIGALRLLRSWGASHRGELGGAVVHPRCGTTLEPRWWCPTCDRIADEDEGDGLSFV
jgi:DNA-binding HxlR family transcriptional regulator